MHAVMSGSQLKGWEVYDVEGKHIGVIDDIALQSSLAKIEYVVVAAKGGAGFATKRYAVPLSALHLDSENECFVLEADRKLEEVPRLEH